MMPANNLRGFWVNPRQCTTYSMCARARGMMQSPCRFAPGWAWGRWRHRFSVCFSSAVGDNVGVLFSDADTSGLWSVVMFICCSVVRSLIRYFICSFVCLLFSVLLCLFVCSSICLQFCSKFEYRAPFFTPECLEIRELYFGAVELEQFSGDAQSCSVWVNNGALPRSIRYSNDYNQEFSRTTFLRRKARSVIY